MNASVKLVFAPGGAPGKIAIRDGKLLSPPEIPAGAREKTLELAEVNTAPGAFPTLVTVDKPPFPFTFALRDVTEACPVYVPEAECFALPGTDPRCYEVALAELNAKHLVSDAARMEREPEESYEHACRFDRDQSCPVWLGLGRDLRIFRVSEQTDEQIWGLVVPRTTPKSRKSPGPTARRARARSASNSVPARIAARASSGDSRTARCRSSARCSTSRRWSTA